MRPDSVNSAGIDIAAVYAVADRFSAAAELIDDAIGNHLTRLAFGGACAGRGHASRGDALRCRLDRLAGELSVAPAAVVRHGATTLQRPPTTLLVEGRVALTIPADWSTQRVVSGPGSARVQVTSPADPEVALHVTQSPVPGETLPGTAQRLKRAIDASPAGVFVDFNPSDIRAGRPAVTYREVRAGHQVRWTILLDGAVRISVGCQSGPGHEDLLREVCAQAVRSVHAVG